MHYHRPAVSEPIRQQSSPDRLFSHLFTYFLFLYMRVWLKKSDSTVVCVVISSLHTDEGVNGDSTVVLEVTSPEDLEDFN